MLQRAIEALDRGVAEGGFADNDREKTRRDVWTEEIGPGAQEGENQ